MQNRARGTENSYRHGGPGSRDCSAELAEINAIPPVESAKIDAANARPAVANFELMTLESGARRCCYYVRELIVGYFTRSMFAVTSTESKPGP